MIKTSVFPQEFFLEIKTKIEYNSQLVPSYRITFNHLYLSLPRQLERYLHLFLFYYFVFRNVIEDLV